MITSALCRVVVLALTFGAAVTCVAASVGAEEQPVRVCDFLWDAVAPDAIYRAVRDPHGVEGWNRLRHPGRPESRYNARRTWLSIRSPSVPYHYLHNSLVFQAGCPMEPSDIWYKQGRIPETNSFTEWQPDIAYNWYDGNYLMVYQRAISPDFHSRIYGVMLDHTGSKIGSPFQIASASGVDCLNAAVAFKYYGTRKFVVVWQAYTGSASAIRAAFVDRHGRVGPELTVSEASEDGWYPDVAAVPEAGGTASPSKHFGIVYDSTPVTGGDTALRMVRLDAMGVVVERLQIAVRDHDAGFASYERRPRIAYGDTVKADYFVVYYFGDAGGISGMILQQAPVQTGQPLGASVTSLGSTAQSAVALSPKKLVAGQEGVWAVAWTDTRYLGTDLWQGRLRMQMFSAAASSALSPIGSSQTVRSGTYDTEGGADCAYKWPTIAGSRSAGYAVAYASGEAFTGGPGWMCFLHRVEQLAVVGDGTTTHSHSVVFRKNYKTRSLVNVLTSRDTGAPTPVHSDGCGRSYDCGRIVWETRFPDPEAYRTGPVLVYPAEVSVAWGVVP